MLKDPGPRCFHCSVGLLRAVPGARAETWSVLAGLTWHPGICPTALAGYRWMVGAHKPFSFFHRFIPKAVARCRLGHLSVP